MNFRHHKSKAGTVFLAGRTDLTNEKLIKQILPTELVFHTEMAGSPFVNIKGKPLVGDLKEAAIMCARYSRDWKTLGGDVKVHRFLGKNISKRKGMKIGTFAVRNVKIIRIKKEEILEFVSNPLKKGELKELKW